MKKTKAVKALELNSKETNKKTQNYSTKTIAFFVLMLFTITVSAQKSKVLDAFSKYGIDAAILNPEKTKRPENYAFDFKQTIITSAKETVTIAKFDPSNPEAERWTVISVDGKKPSKSETNSFRKNQNKATSENQFDDASYKVEKETPDRLIVSYKVDANSLSKENAFMKDCRFYMTINLKTKKLEQIQALNEKPVKINILNADKFDLVLKYKWNEQEKQYFPTSENVNIEAKFIGQATDVETITEYSNYTKK